MRRFLAGAALVMIASSAAAQTQSSQLAEELERARKHPMDYVLCSAYYAGSAAYLAATGYIDESHRTMTKANHFKLFIAAAHYYVKNKTLGDGYKAMSEELSAAVAKDIQIPGQKAKYDTNYATRCLLLGEIVAVGMSLGGM